MRFTPAEGVRDAVGLMTAWSAQPDGPPSLLIEVLGEHLDKRPPELALAEATELLMGMTALCGILLALNEEATDLDMEVILREVALRYAKE
jgi:hypothetical protein